MKTASMEHPVGEEHPRSVRHLRERLRHELQSIATVAGFFFLSFTLLQLTRAAILGRFGLHGIDPFRAVVGALVMAKAVVLADAFRFVSRFDHRPIVFAAAWKSWIYLPLALLFEYADALLENRRLGFPEASRTFADHLRSPIFWMLQTWLLILLFGFAATRDIVRRVGGSRFRELFFGRSRSESTLHPDAPAGPRDPSGP